MTDRSAVAHTLKGWTMPTRREFLSTAAMTIAALPALSCSKLNTGNGPALSNDQYGEFITLGRTGLRVNRLGFGTGYFFRDVEQQEAVRFAHEVLDAGVNLFDTAWNYGRNLESWKILGEVFKTRNRDDYILCNKLEWREERDVSHQTVEGQVDTALKMMNVDYFDIYLIHNINDASIYELSVDRRYMEDMVRLKETGKLRYLGISGHSNTAMIEMCKRYPEIDVILVGHNIMGSYWPFEGDSKILIDYANEHNIGLMVMKPMVRGLPQQNQEDALKHVLGFPSVVPIPGMQTLQQLQNNLKLNREFAALSVSEQSEWAKPQTVLNCPVCTKCEYCIKSDSQGIDVPQLVTAAQLGEHFAMKEWYSNRPTRRKLKEDIQKVTPELAKQFTQKCPLELPVDKLLQQSAKYIA